MGATNSAWYLRVAPDEAYFEPCAWKAGFHDAFTERWLRAPKASFVYSVKR